MAGPQARLWYRFCRFICWLILKFFTSLTAEGTENVPDEGGVILASNHASYFDPPLVGSSLEREVAYMARKTLFRVRIAGALISSVNAFPVDRGKGALGGIREMTARLEEGYAVVMFPEGTRTPDGSLQEISTGVGLVAVRSAAPVVPVYVWGSFGSWSRHRKWPSRHPVRVFFGPPVAPAKLEEGDRDRRKAEQERIRAEVEAGIKALEAKAAEWAEQRGLSVKGTEDTADETVSAGEA